MRRFGWPAPARQGWLVLAGLLAIYIGERLVPQFAVARWVFTGGGSALVLALTALRLVAWRHASPEGRRLALLFLVTTAGCALAVLGFLLAGPVGRALGLVEDGEGRLRTGLIVVASILLAVSLVPLLAAQWAAKPARAGQDAGALDRLRAYQLAAAGATVALAGAALMLLGYVAAARDATLDLSYFKTASPGEPTTRITKSLGEPLQVVLFFPPNNEVADQVLGYFRALQRASGNVRIERHDRLASPALAEKLKVTEDGTFVLSVGERHEGITVPVTLRDARPRLRELDELVQRAAMRVARAPRTVYFTAGHGELSEQVGPGQKPNQPYGGLEAFRSLFGLLNYGVSNLAVQSGLALAVPPDAAMVVVLGPKRPFLAAELDALDRYLAKGGSLLLALDPGTEFVLGPLEQRLGIGYRNVPLADEEQHLRLNDSAADRGLIVTDRFSSHAAVSTLGQAGVGAGIALLGAGSLVVDPTSRATAVVQSLPSTFSDTNRNFQLDEGSEQRDSYALVAAVDKPAAPGAQAPADTSAGAAAGSGHMRAVVFADADLFSDAVVTSLGLNAALASDVVRWLGHEEEFSGETRSEEDVPVVHTRTEDVGWFYATIFGVPALVLGLGLLGVRRRRRGTEPGRES